MKTIAYPLRELKAFGQKNVNFKFLNKHPYDICQSSKDDLNYR